MNKYANLFILICILAMLIPVFGQPNFVDLRGTLIQIENIPSPSLQGDKEFWDLVSQGKAIIPKLTKLLTDTTQTLAIVPEIGGNYTAADAAYAVITAMIPYVPTDSFIPVKWQADSSDYWGFVRADIENRKTLQYEFTKWYNRNRDNIAAVDTTGMLIGNRDSLSVYRLQTIPPAESTRWISLSYGIGGSGFGLLNRFAICTFSSKHMITLRYIRAREFCLCIAGCDCRNPLIRIDDFGILFGGCKFNKKDLTAISFGISFCTGIDRGEHIELDDYKKIDFTTIGLIAEGTTIIAKPGDFGLTLSFFGNLNKQHSYVGGSLGLAFRSYGDDIR